MSEQAGLWDSIYASREEDRTRDPNPQLVAETSDLAPGVVLEIGGGEGADAQWLAARGWRVTAVDISAVAIERARKATAEYADQIEWVCADLLQWVPPASFDLVTSHFVHFLPADRAVAMERLGAAVRRHGTLLVVAHHPSDLQTTAKRWPVPEAFCTADDLAAYLTPGEWEVLVADARPREVRDPDGNPVTVHDVILRARRRYVRARRGRFSRKTSGSDSTPSSPTRSVASAYDRTVDWMSMSRANCGTVPVNPSTPRLRSVAAPARIVE